MSTDGHLHAKSARIAELEAALEPFADFADDFVDEHGWRMLPGRVFDWFGPSDFRRARAALREEPSDG